MIYKYFYTQFVGFFFPFMLSGEEALMLSKRRNTNSYEWKNDKNEKNSGKSSEAFKVWQGATIESSDIHVRLQK